MTNAIIASHHRHHHLHCASDHSDTPYLPQQTMMMLATILVALLSLVVTAEKLEIKLEPAPAYHNATGCCGDDAIFFFSVLEPPSYGFCDAQTTIGPPPPEGHSFPQGTPAETVCGGTFFVNLALYDGIEFVFQAPKEEEIVMESDENNRLEFQFQATAECDMAPGEYIEIGGSSIAMNLVGSNVDSLKNHWNPDSSGVIVGRCEQGCSFCEIFGSFQIGGEDTTPAFTAQASTMSWSITYDSSLFQDSLDEYRYDTSGYCWIRTPYSPNALVPAVSPTVAPPTISDSPTNNPPPPTSPPGPTTVPSTSGAGSVSILIVVGTTLVLIQSLLWSFYLASTA